MTFFVLLVSACLVGLLGAEVMNANKKLCKKSGFPLANRPTLWYNVDITKGKL